MPLELPGSPNVPIIGAPYEIASWVLIVNVECKQCDGDPARGKPYLLTLVSRMSLVCPGCGAEYTLVGMTWDPQTNEASFYIKYAPPNAKRLEYEEKRTRGH